MASYIGHILPNQHSETVAVVEPSGWLNLDMLAYHIEAQFLGLFDVESHCLGSRSGIESVRPPALVQRAELEEDFVVESQSLHSRLVSFFGNLAHCGITLHAVYDLAVAKKGNLEPVKIWAVHAPEFRLRNSVYHFSVCRCLSLGNGKYATAWLLGIVAYFRTEYLNRYLVACGSTFAYCCNRYFARGNVSAHIVVGNITRLRHIFHPYGLPYSRHRSVPYSVRIAHLLAARDGPGRVVGRVENSHDDFCRAVFECLGYIQTEGCKSSGMAECKFTVHVNIRSPVHCIEMQEGLLPRLRTCNGGPVPEHLILTHSASHARKRRLHAERHENLTVSLLHHRQACRSDGIVPKSIEVLPVLTHHLRTRIFGTGIFRIHFGCPGGTDFVSRRGPIINGRCTAGGKRHRQNRAKFLHIVYL